MTEAMKIIGSNDGFMVSFEHCRGCVLIGDSFPDKHAGEELISTEAKAWDLAIRFANKTKGKCVNIYVVDANFSPIKGYKKREIKNR